MITAFATSVSAKSVTLKQAVIIAGICEFLGAMLLGASVTSTIKGKMIDTSLYEDEPDVLMYGMLTSLVAASFILGFANYLALPVSTTHTIVGSIVGFSLAAKGWRSIQWMQVGKVFISWVAAPVITGTCAAILFGLTRYFILRSEDPYQRSIKLYPLIIFAAIGLGKLCIFYYSNMYCYLCGTMNSFLCLTCTRPLFRLLLLLFLLDWIGLADFSLY